MILATDDGGDVFCVAVDLESVTGLQGVGHGVLQLTQVVKYLATCHEIERNSKHITDNLHKPLRR